MAAERYLCIHGHFYQPPREHPWLECVERQPSAAPWHDWNERVTHECYGPNTAARVVNSAGEIIDIRNNFGSISFNFGPTLLSWLQEHRPIVYEGIIAADKASVAERGGHGNAVAQAYNHMIMPLATARDKATQVTWGLEDFRRRFGRDPEGMWLPETAGDLETLGHLASQGIKYTILAPGQARAWRETPHSNWMKAEGGAIDPRRPYVCSLPGGRQITLFFYDGPASQGVAFEHLLSDGVRFARRLASLFQEGRKGPQLAHIATDGESYGHHHRFGEMALAFALHTIETERLGRLTNYGEFLALHPPVVEVEVWPASSWSCFHGVERWRSNCGCSTGGNSGWNQEWRKPLREALDLLKKEADRVYDEVAPAFLVDPWKARDEYIQLVLDRSPGRVRDFFAAHGVQPMTPHDSLRALRLLEMQRHSMLMFTSCAWFFDDIAGIEPIQNLRYAARVMQLIGAYADGIEPGFLELLARARSNEHGKGNGAQIWSRSVRPLLVNLRRVMAHCAISGFDRREDGTDRFFGFELQQRTIDRRAFGNTSVRLSRFSVTSVLDGESEEATVVVLHFGGHDFHCCVGRPLSEAEEIALAAEVMTTFGRHSMVDVVRLLDRHFPDSTYGLRDLFPDGKMDLLERVSEVSLHRLDSSLRLLFEENRKLVGYLLEVGAAPPKAYVAAAEFVLRSELIKRLGGVPSPDELQELIEIAGEARTLGLRLVDHSAAFVLRASLDAIFRHLAQEPTVELCRLASGFLDLMETLEHRTELWMPQNICFALLHGRPLPSHLRASATAPGPRTQDCLPELRQLGNRLRIAPTPLKQG